MGADRGIHIEIEASEYENVQPIHVSKILAKICAEEKVDLVILGKQVSWKRLHSRGNNIIFRNLI